MEQRHRNISLILHSSYTELLIMCWYVLCVAKKRKKQARAAAPSPRPQDQLLATIRALEFSSDESHLFVCGDDKKVRMLSAKDGEVLGTR